MNLNGLITLYNGEFSHLHTDLCNGKRLKNIAHEHPRLLIEVDGNLRLLEEAYRFYLQTRR
nr:hypothetical protein [uncultured archaeon]